MAWSNPFALPTLFRASAIHVPDGSTGHASAGVHLRVHPHPALGLPLHPFVAFPMHDVSVDTVEMRWSAPGFEFPGPFFPGELVVHGHALGSNGDRLPPEWVWLAVQSEAVGGGDARVDVLARTGMPDGTERILATRRRDPFAFGGIGMGRLRVTGSINVNGVLGVHAARLDPPTFSGEPPVRFGPSWETGPWYDPGPDPRGDQEQRVLLGIAPEAGPPDAADEFITLDPSTERDRILGELGPGAIDAWLAAAFGDAVPPVAVVVPEERTTSGGVVHSARLRAVDLLLTAAVDPEIARYLGLATVIPSDNAGLGRWGTGLWYVGGRFIVQPGRRLNASGRTLRQALDARPSPGWLPDYLDGIFPEAAAIAQRIAAENAGLPPEEQWEVVSLYTVAAVAADAPPDPPDALNPEIRHPGTWNPSGGEAAGAWTQVITLPGRHAEGPLAFAREDPDTGQPTSLHRRNPGGRAAALLAGWSSAGDRIRTPSGLAMRRRERTVTDGAVPGDASPVRWWLWQGDEWGRWSDPATVDAERPPRPAPAPPVLEVSFVEASPDGSAGTEPSPGPRPPGTLRVAVHVRREGSSAPGALPIAAVELSSDAVTAWHGPDGAVDGSTARFDLAAPVGDPAVVLTADLAPTEVGGRYDLTLSAIAIDVDGAASEPEITRRPIHDPRRPIPIPTGPQVLWASEPSGAGRSELAIRWNAPTGARFRVYLGDEGRLAAALGLTVDPDELRASRARRVWVRRAELRDRRLFTLLTEAPIEARDGGVAFRHPLPGSLRGVQFVRVVPVSAGGLEADFPQCGLVPVAIPGDLAPPAPALTVTAGPNEATLVIRVVSRGLRADLLAARAPAPPEFRIRRTRGGATDLLAMPIVASGALAPAPDGSWVAEVVDGSEPAAGGASGSTRPLPPFVRHTYVAEVRYPPEPGLPPGVQPVTDPLAVTPAVADAPKAAASAWSEPSAPASSMVVPDAPPPAPTVVTFTPDPVTGSASITIHGPPVGHPAGPRHAALLARVASDGGLVTLPTAEIVGAPTVITDPDGAWAMGYRVAILDPLGRMSPFTTAVPGP